MQSFVRNLRGVIVFGVLAINTIFWVTPLMLLAVVKLLLPIPALRLAVTRILMVIGESWVSVNTAIFRVCGSIDWESRGFQNLRRDGWYLVIANHQTWVDIVVLQEIFNRRVPFLKFFIKRKLIWFPFLGLAWWALDMPFMKRYSPSYLARNPQMKGKDVETTRRACEKFRDTPTSILNFIEGTRFSDQKRVDRQSDYRNLLKPRAGGFAAALSSMGELFTSIVDVTLVYPDGAAGFWGMCCGGHVRVIVDVRERELEDWLLAGNYQDDRAFRKQMQCWLGDIWAEKDDLISSMKDVYGS